MNLGEGKNLLVLTQQKLKENVHYNPETGVFTRLKAKGGRNVGDVTGSVLGKGYLGIKINGIGYKAHRLAWLYVTGEMPEDCIDHINGIRDDNRFCNLRKATNCQNTQNRRSPQKGCQTGFLGVSLDKRSNRFRARITVNEKTINLGFYDTPEEASMVYTEAKRKYHPFSTI